MEIQIVWLKRDIRWRDHEPLHHAIERGLPVLLLYCFEPSMMQAPDADDRHWRFVYQSLHDLQQNLQQQGCENALQMVQGEVLDVFAEIAQTHEVKTLLSYQETGNALSYARDKLVAAWCKSHGITWKEWQTNGVQRGRKNRDHWSAEFDKRMATPEVIPQLAKANLVALPKALQHHRASDTLPESIASQQAAFQPGGESWAWKYLESFVHQRVKDYSKGISKPLLSRSSCSRLSPYLAWGCISMRSLFHYLQQHKNQCPNKRALHNFRSRLYWHCHFIQKFEMEERYEFENINRGFNQLAKPLKPAWVKAWETGQTGFPLVDACMRCVRKTGYLNFRMRAMVASFLTQNLWQPWQAGAPFLARQFLDYEPGIHYPQLQMQAGMTGTNTFRIYNVVKQAQDHDPDAVFIKKWLPELAALPAPFAREPWTMTAMEQSFYGFALGRDYPERIVDHEESAHQARKKLGEAIKNPETKQESRRILQTHVRLSDQKAHRSKADKALINHLRQDHA